MLRVRASSTTRSGSVLAAVTIIHAVNPDDATATTADLVAAALGRQVTIAIVTATTPAPTVATVALATATAPVTIAWGKRGRDFGRRCPAIPTAAVRRRVTISVALGRSPSPSPPPDEFRRRKPNEDRRRGMFLVDLVPFEALSALFALSAAAAATAGSAG